MENKNNFVGNIVQIIPLFLKKYEVLIKWADKKTGSYGGVVEYIKFTKNQILDDKWDVVLYIDVLVSNKSVFIVKRIIDKDFKEISHNFGIDINTINYSRCAFDQVPTLTNDGLVYDVGKNMILEIKKPE
jgi:hypothetical protein